jgi:hypothetical protein
VGLVHALEGRPDHPLADLTSVTGAGVYAIYYIGARRPFAAYEPLARANEHALRQPIYVGKAVPPGARKGRRRSPAGTGEAWTSLATRLNDHRASVDAAENLDIRDFRYRYLPVKAFWIPTMERLLIERYAPLWNQVVDGFGNKTQGSERDTTAPSAWDTIHPGRLRNLEHRKKSRLSRDQVMARIGKALASPEADMLADTANATETMTTK